MILASHYFAPPLESGWFNSFYCLQQAKIGITAFVDGRGLESGLTQGAYFII